MKEITAQKCDFCGRIMETKKGMQVHEKRCYKNPASKSCITCAHYVEQALFVDNRRLTEIETDLYLSEDSIAYQVKFRNEDNEPSFIFKPEFEYFERIEAIVFCEAKSCQIEKLQTSCNLHSPR
jgi:hypothetical protein